MKTTFAIQLTIAPIYAPTNGINEKPIPRIMATTTTITMKTITSSKFLTTKSTDLLVLSTASVRSIMAIVMINRATGINTKVMKHIAEIMATTISMSNLPVTKSMLFRKSTGRLLMMSISIDLHVGQIQGYFDIPVDNIFSAPIVLNYIRKHFKDSLSIISPDPGGVERARAFARRLNASLAIIDKRREAPNVAEAMNIIGDVKGKTAIILDDMVDTGGTLVQAAQALIKHGATRVDACCTHPVLSGDATNRIEGSPIEILVVTNTIPLGQKSSKCSKVEVISVAEILGEAIKRVYFSKSVSSLFV